MKKTILTIALLSAALAANASTPSKSILPAAAGGAVAAGVIAATAGAGAAAAVPAAAAASAVAAAAIEQATVSVTGASTVAGAPLLLSLDGAKPVDPNFDVLFKAGQAHPKWKVTQVKADGEKSRMFLKSATGKATLEMDVATALVQGLKIKKDTVIGIETQSSGQGALIKFVKDKTPLGFMVNKATQVR
jgi:hypothetical protein